MKRAISMLTRQKAFHLRGATASLALIAAFLLAPAAVSGDELWIDGPDAVQPGVDRQFPAAAVDPFGRAVFAWEAFTASTRNDIYLRRYSVLGVPLGDPAIVNTYTSEDQRQPRIAVAGDGSFLVVWRSVEPGPNPADPLGHWVRSRRFDAAGNPTGGEEWVNTLNAAIPGGDLQVDVAALAGGGYVVVWRSANGGTDPNTKILARLLSATGVPTGSPFQVNVEEANAQHHSAVAPLADGGFVVAWTVPGVAIRRFAANGAPVTGQIDVNLSASGFDADIATAPDGRVAVVWEEGGTTILGRLFDSTLDPLGPEFAVNDPLDTDPDEPEVTSLGRLGFLVVWESFTGLGSDADDQSVQARLVTGPGQFAGGQEQLNSFEEGAQHNPAVGVGKYVAAIAWHSAGGNPAEPTDDSILGGLIDLCWPLFCDDFEVGSALRWSAATAP